MKNTFPCRRVGAKTSDFVSLGLGRCEMPAFFSWRYRMKTEMKKWDCEKKFLKYVSMNVLGMLGLSFYILADTWFISKGVGVNGLTALNLAIPIYSFVHGCGLMLGMGGASRYSILRGGGKDEDAERMFLLTLLPAVVLIGVFVFCGIFFSRNIAGMMGAEGTVYEMTECYLRFIFLFSPAFILNDICNCFVRNDGNPKLAMGAMLTGSLMNIILDYVFVFPLGWGMFGAVFATGLAPVFGMLVLSRHFIKRKNGFLLWKRKKTMTWNLHEIKSVLLIGIPSLVGEVSSGIVILVLNAIIMKLDGETGVAAYGVIANLSLVVIAIYTGIAQGIQPLQSRYFGGRRKKERKRTFLYALFVVFGVSVLIYLLLVINVTNVVGAFNSEGSQVLQEIAEQGIRWYFTGIVFAGMNIIISADFAAAGRGVPAQIISVLRGILLMVPAAYLLSFVWGMPGVWLTFPVVEGGVFVVGSIFYRKGKRRG